MINLGEKMKLILIKDCKDGKANQIIEVSDGYGMNYLVKNGLGVPFNKQNEHKLGLRLAKIQSDLEAQRVQAETLKAELEALRITFKLKSTNDVIHGSITTKQIKEELRKANFNLDKHVLNDVHIKSFGQTVLKLVLFKAQANLKEVVANLTIQVDKE